MSQSTTHPSLLSRLRDHDDDAAWREFDKRYRDLILRYCRRRGLQQTDAEDVRQMVMLNLARQLRTFQYSTSRGRFRGYLGRVVANAIHRYFRRPKTAERGLDTDVASDLAASEADELDREWETEWMLHHYRIAMNTVRETSEPKSVAIFEHLLQGKSTETVAEHFGMTRDSVQKVKQRMRNRLRAAVEKQVADEEDYGPTATD